MSCWARVAIRTKDHESMLMPSVPFEILARALQCLLQASSTAIITTERTRTIVTAIAQCGKDDDLSAGSRLFPCVAAGID